MALPLLLESVHGCVPRLMTGLLGHVSGCRSASYELLDAPLPQPGLANLLNCEYSVCLAQTQDYDLRTLLHTIEFSILACPIRPQLQLHQQRARDLGF